MKPTEYSEYPLILVIARVFMLSAIVITGLIITYNSIILVYSYLFLVIFILFFTVLFVCRFCCYFGKLCDKGFGKLAKLIFKYHLVDYKKFQFYGNICTVLIIIFLLFPVIYGVVLSVTTFDKMNIGLTVLSLLLGTVYIATQQFISCPHCAMNKYCGIYVK
ncbi:MAG: hypothetical protein WBK20_06620 [Spirochaetota bacterium]